MSCHFEVICIGPKDVLMKPVFLMEAEKKKNLATLVDLLEQSSLFHQHISAQGHPQCDLGVTVNDPDEGLVTKHVLQ